MEENIPLATVWSNEPKALGFRIETNLASLSQRLRSSILLNEPNRGRTRSTVLASDGVELNMVADSRVTHPQNETAGME
jgi:hypothetical protein